MNKENDSRFRFRNNNKNQVLIKRCLKRYAVYNLRCWPLRFANTTCVHDVYVVYMYEADEADDGRYNYSGSGSKCIGLSLVCFKLLV